jgi:glyoxylase-like metal-dependent hydrolase (beta-lactamase superfamily II)
MREQIQYKTLTKWSALTALALACGPLAASAVEQAAGVLRRANVAMGAEGLQSLRYTADGIGYTFGQAYVPGQAWPKIDIQEQTRVINYDSGSMREDIAFSRGELKGGGGYPASGQVRNTGLVGGGYAWNIAGGNPSISTRSLADRTHQLWVTPQGIIKAAMRNNATLTWTTRDGKNIALVSFTEPGKFSATAHINEAYLVEKIESVFPDAVMGDTRSVTTFSGYRDIAGIKFPAKIEQSLGGFPVLAVNVKTVERNVAADMPVPDAVRAPYVERVTADKVADGVWFLAGGSHNSVLIEMKDHLILVESPLGDVRASAVIEQAKKLVPGKPLTTLINSHNHFDHSGGVRAAVANGLKVVTQAKNKAYFEKTFATANKIAPDLLAKSGKKARFQGYEDKLVLKDATRTLEIHRIVGNNHSETFAMIYLPKEKLLIEADAFTPGAPNAPAPATANAFTVNLVENIHKLNLSVERILPLHGRVVSVAEMYTAAKMTPR